MSEVSVCVAVLRLCLPVNQPVTCTLPVSKAQKGLTVPPIVREERLHRFFCYFCYCLALFCLPLSVDHTAVRCSLNTFRPSSSSSSSEEAAPKKCLFFRDSSHQITATVVVNSTRPDPPSTGLHCLKLKVLFECLNTCMSAYLRVYIGVRVHVHVVTSLDQRRLYFILRLT